MAGEWQVHDLELRTPDEVWMQGPVLKEPFKSSAELRSTRA